MLKSDVEKDIEEGGLKVLVDFEGDKKRHI